MGMFLSKYSMLNALAYHGDQVVYDETRKLLSRFNLFGVLLHDPNNQRKFHLALEGLYEKLDYLTGQKFLFFALTNPPADWIKAHPRDYYQVWESFVLLSPKNAYETVDESATAYALARSLNIDYDDLPVLILTSDFESSEFYVVRTAEDLLERQLTELGYYASTIESRVDIYDRKLGDLMGSISKKLGYEQVHLNRSLASVFSDYLSFVVAPKSTTPDTAIAKRQVKSIVTSRIVKSESDLMQSSSSSDKESFLSYLLNILPKKPQQEVTVHHLANDSISHYHTLACPSNDAKIWDSEFDVSELFEPESRIVYNTYRKVLPFYEKIIRHYDPIELNEIDFSPLILNICKTFEIEINHSIAQWIRKNLMIEMPEFYKIHKEDDQKYLIIPDSMFVPMPRAIDFNKGRGLKWFSPGIGETELAFKTHIFSNQYPINIRDVDSLLSSWEVIRKYRNMLTHSEVLNKSEYTTVKVAFDSIAMKGIFKDFQNLKSSLRGSNSSMDNTPVF